MLEAQGCKQLLEHWSDKNEPSNPQAASSLFNGMVSPLAQTPIGGVIWYHGTANIGRGEQYSRLFPLFIKSWRTHFRSNELPFYFVQPAPYRFEDLGTDALPEIWDAQLKTFKTTSKLGMVVTTDLADPQLVNNRHKLTIAKRLSGWAFKHCYFAALAKKNPTTTDSEKPNEGTNVEIERGPQESKQENRENSDGANSDGANSDGANSAVNQNICSGPIYDSAKIEGNSIVIAFRYAQSELKISQDAKNSFTICGEDKKFVTAQVRVDGQRLIVSHPDIKIPIAVRYAWTDTAQPGLTNSSGLPAAPFRTDDFPLTSSGIEF